MKRRKYERPVQIFAVLLLVAIVAIITGPLGGFAASAGLYQSVVGAPVAGTVDTPAVEAGAPGLNKPSVSQKITLIKPSATPLDTIFREFATQVPIKNFKTEFYSVGTRGLTDTVTTTVTETHTVTEQPVFEIVVGDINIWSIDDTFMACGLTATNYTGLNLVCMVYDIDMTASKIKCIPLNSTVFGTSGNAGKMILATTIPATTVLVRMGNAKSEKDAQTSPFAMIPAKDYNYAQIFMAQVEESFYQRITQQEVDWGFSDYERMNIEDMKARQEYSFMFGARAKVIDPLGKDEKHMCGGILNSITKGVTYGTGGTNRTMSVSDYVNITKSLFVGNSGADNRYLFASAGLLATMHSCDAIQKQLAASQTEVKWGITFKKLETNFGTINIKHHALLDYVYGWGDKGFVLDVTQLEKHTFKELGTKNLDLKTSGQSNVDATVIDEASCPVLRYPDTHCIVSPKA